jgi:hypothetical protein
MEIKDEMARANTTSEMNVVVGKPERRRPLVKMLIICDYNIIIHKKK